MAKNEWISAAEALSLVSDDMGPVRAAEAICSRAYDGLVAAQARRLVVRDVSVDYEVIPTLFWWAKGQAALEQNWVSGDFATWIERRDHWRAYGVQFKRVDIEEMLPRRASKLTIDKSRPGNYAPAAQCIMEVCATAGCSESDAEKCILRYCRAGLVPSRCEKLWWRVSYRHGPVEDEDFHVSVPDWFWEHCLDDGTTILNWRTGQFSGRGTIDGEEHKVVAHGVEFQIGAILTIADDAKSMASAGEPTAEPLAQSPTQTDVRGRRLSSQWTPWVAELAAYIHGSGIPDGVGSQGQEEMIKALADALAAKGLDGPARTTVQPVVQAVLDRLRSAGN